MISMDELSHEVPSCEYIPQFGPFLPKAAFSVLDLGILKHPFAFLCFSPSQACLKHMEYITLVTTLG